MGSSVLARIFRDYCSEHEVRVPSDSNENDTVLYKVLSEAGVRACERIVDTMPWDQFKNRGGKRAYLAQCKAQLDKLPFLPSSRGQRVWDARAAAIYLHDVESTDSGGGTGEEPHYSLKDSRGAHRRASNRRWCDMPDKEQRKVLKDVMDGHGELFSHSHADSLLLDRIFKEQQQIHQQQPQLDLTQR